LLLVNRVKAPQYEPYTFTAFAGAAGSAGITDGPFVAENENLTREFVVAERGRFFRITQMP
jgi:hypothetical protein